MSYKGGHLNYRIPHGYKGCMWENLPHSPPGDYNRHHPLVEICKFVCGVWHHGSDPDQPHSRNYDHHKSCRVCGTSLTDEKFRQILFRAFDGHPQWQNVDIGDPKAVHKFFCGVSIGKVRFQVLADQIDLEICLWRAVQGHSWFSNLNTRTKMFSTN